MPKWNRTIHYFLGVRIRREKKKYEKKTKENFILMVHT